MNLLGSLSFCLQVQQCSGQAAASAAGSLVLGSMDRQAGEATAGVVSTGFLKRMSEAVRNGLRDVDPVVVAAAVVAAPGVAALANAAVTAEDAEAVVTAAVAADARARSGRGAQCGGTALTASSEGGLPHGCATEDVSGVEAGDPAMKVIDFVEVLAAVR